MAKAKHEPVAYGSKPDDTEEVRFAAIPNHLGYAIGSDGFAYSCRNKGMVWRKLKPTPQGAYWSVALPYKPRQRKRYLHHLVLEAFVGPRPEGMEACHYPDGDRRNNAASNLMWATRGENVKHTMEAGNWTNPTLSGEQNGNSSMTEEKVSEVFRLRELGWGYGRIAQVVGCHKSNVASIVKGKTWRKKSLGGQ